jgi:hypothetical protein
VANKILVARGTKARIEEIKSTLATNELVYSTDTGELGVKKANGEIEYFKNAADIDAIMTGKQDKLVAGDNITIDESTNVISAEVDLNEMAYFNFASNIYGDKYSLLENAWGHSFTVDPLEISADSTWSATGGIAQYPNGGTEGVIIPHGVTSIGKYAFYGGPSSNQPIVIPNSVTSIGKNAFNSWTKNNHPLVIPSSVTSIGSGAFAFWSANNKPLVIPESVTIIEEEVFSFWVSNTHPLIIPKSVTSIGVDAFFRWDTNPHPIIIPHTVKSIGVMAFYKWSLVPYIVMKRTTPPTLANANAFDGQGNAPIYVPDESVDDYKTATNWVDLASRIFPISDKADVIGDIKSALDAILGV